MFTNSVFIFGIFCCIFHVSAAYKSATDNVIVEHSFNGKVWSQRGRYQIQRSNERFILEDKESTKQLQEFKDLLERNGLYHIRIRYDGNDRNFLSTASIPACDLQKSGFREDIVVHTRGTKLGGDDTDLAADIVGLSYTSPLLALPRACDSGKLLTFPKFATKIHESQNKIIASIPSTVQGPRPPMFKDLRIGDDTDAAVGAQGAAEQSFLRKYWYVVLPMVIFVMFGGGGAEEPKKDGAGAGGAVPPAAAK